MREALSRILETPAADRSEEDAAKLPTNTARLRDIEPEIRAAIAASPEETGTVSTEDAEARERRELRGRVLIGNHVLAAMESRNLDGAELEYNQALGLKATGAFPLELLASQVEHREVTGDDSATQARPWLDRLFSESSAMRVGVSFESVPAGVANFPVIKTAGTPAQRGKQEAADDAAWTIGVSELKPTRNAVRAVFSEEDAMRLPGLEEALRRNLAMGLTEKVDRTVFVGDSTASGTNADIAGLNTLANVVEKEINQTNKVKGPETLTAFAELVDGKHSSGLEDLRIVAAVGANALWLVTRVSGNNAAIQTMAAFMREAGMTWTVRGDIEAATTAGKFGAFLGRGRGIEGAGVAAVWNSGIFIRDPYNAAAKGRLP